MTTAKLETLCTTISALRPGQSIELSRTEYGYCTAERSGDGKTLRFIRHSENRSVVFQSENA